MRPEANREAFAQEVYEFLFSALGLYDARKIWYAGQKIFDIEQRDLYYAHVVADVQALLDGEKPAKIKDALQYKRQPVSIREFVCSENYMNAGESIYPKVMDELEELNSGKYVEAVLTGGIGSAKTTVALYTNIFQLYLLSCLHNPHKLYGLDPSSEILLIFQSINAKLAKELDFKRFKAMVDRSKYFPEKYPYNKNTESKLVFPNRIEVVPVSGQETAAIGQNVIGGLIDELNYMSVVEKSKQSVDHNTYDQAIALYNSIARRRKSRFLMNGKMPGILCLVSSKRYPGQFTDIKQEEATRDPTIFVYDYRVWEVKPPGSFSGDMFQVFVGDLARKPRVMKEGEMLSEDDRVLITHVPVEFREEFDKDIINALREIAGISTLARHPYFVDVEKVAASFGSHGSIFSREECDFVLTKVGLYPQRFYKSELPRFAHVDLAVSSDSAGLTIGTISEFKSIKELLGGTDESMMPVFHIDGTLEIKPPKNGEILFWKIREVLLKLRELGLPIRWITFDSYQSKDSQQILKQQGFIVGEQSIDTSVLPYDFLKSACYSGRLRMPKHHKLALEMVSLEFDGKTGKVDHPQNSSKDCSDSLAGVVYGLTRRRELWAYHRVPPTKVPESIRFQLERKENMSVASASDMESPV